MNILVFDIETIPDTQAGKQALDLAGQEDTAIAQAMFANTLEKKGSEFLPLHWHQVAVISMVIIQNGEIKVRSLGDEHTPEATVISRFMSGIEKLRPQLVSYNGSGFDLPVLHYRMMRHGISAPLYWENGEHDPQFKWNNYTSRYHQRHLDLMDVLSAYQPRAFVPLDGLSAMLGFPGKMGMSGAKVWDAYCDGDFKGIRDYCEMDVLNTYLVYLKFELMRGHLNTTDYDNQTQALKTYLQNENKAHLTAFLEQWNKLEELTDA